MPPCLLPARRPRRLVEWFPRRGRGVSAERRTGAAAIGRAPSVLFEAGVSTSRSWLPAAEKDTRPEQRDIFCVESQDTAY